MTHIRSLTSQEIDDGWRLDEAPLELDIEPYAEIVIVDERLPSSGFEEAYWMQVERLQLKRRYDDASSFGAKRPN